jgi:hypothetical protein
MEDIWMSARFTEALPSVAVPPQLHKMVMEHAEASNMKIAEVVRKALIFYLSNGLTDSKPKSPNSKPKKAATSKKSRKKAEAQS